MPILETDVYLSSAPRLFQRFVTVIEDRHWLRRVKLLKDHSKRNDFLRAHHASENAIAFQLNTCSELSKKYGHLRPEDVEQHGLMPALGIMTQVLSLQDGLPAPQRKALIGRVRGTLSNPEDMRAFQLEMMVATHFGLRGNLVRWPELEPDHPTVRGATFDLLIEDIGESGLEVECKAVSHDKGRTIHRAGALTFYEELRHELAPLSGEIRTGLVVIVTVPDALPAARDGQRELASRVHSQVIAGSSATFDDGVQVRIEPFDMARLRDVEIRPDTPAARAVVDSVTGTRNRGALVMGRRNVGAILVVVQSMKDDSLMSAVFDTARVAARRQLTAQRPGIVLLGFNGIEADQLASIAQQDSDPSQPPTAARVAVSEFLGSSGRAHVVGVGFLSRNELTRRADGQMDHGGLSYYFHNEPSPFWRPDFRGMFGVTDRSA
ncbi:hypothetical protein LMG22037_05646 [Paraburkholderia phenoliruptrix]|jgi:hypothetical protein|uniref:Uncharacterized protein n=1 Tax=Paraburkholderia phenoliruptrix TaxID=252970 RepID=A0A6J5CD98_9BURK|nr:hypothetical protein [Paraburkholderia phenoliruptrix]CAB3731828.1 hypothetical protein LMG22037_05646 [Paraburkholderia phenoliruptrix]